VPDIKSRILAGEAKKLSALPTEGEQSPLPAQTEDIGADRVQTNAALRASTDNVQAWKSGGAYNAPPPVLDDNARKQIGAEVNSAKSVLVNDALEIFAKA